jgi:aryl-alcohol dehydrogenase-like predicted oxidoreductase
MSLTSYITIGRSGLRVSPFCLGAMTFGQDIPGFGISVEDSEAILERYLAQGGNFIDTANAYSRGHSEKIIGDFFRKGRFQRDRAVIATKFFTNLFAGDPNGGGGGRKAIIAQCEESLRRLQTDYIDLYYLHNWDRFTPIDETMRALDDLVTAGKVRYIGISDTPAWKVAQAQVMGHFSGWNPIVALQIEYSLMERTVEGELVPMAQELGLGVLPWGPLKNGALTGKYTRENGVQMSGPRGAFTGGLTDRQYSIIDAVGEIAKQRGVSSSTVALAWLNSRPGVSSVLLGVSSVTQLDANIEALELTLSEEEIARLDEVSKPVLNFPAEFLSGSPSISHAGATVNGVPSRKTFFTPDDQDTRW